MKPFLAAVLAGLALMTAHAHVLAEPKAHATQPLELRKIMKDLGKNMQAITDGISREDWELVEKTAPLIADHPQPPMAEKMRIMSFMGTNMGKFKAHDGETHEPAQAVGKAAKAKTARASYSPSRSSRPAVTTATGFRKPFVEHFYGEEMHGCCSMTGFNSE